MTWGSWLRRKQPSLVSALARESATTFSAREVHTPWRVSIAAWRSEPAASRWPEKPPQPVGREPVPGISSLRPRLESEKGGQRRQASHPQGFPGVPQLGSAFRLYGLLSCSLSISPWGRGWIQAKRAHWLRGLA